MGNTEAKKKKEEMLALKKLEEQEKKISIAVLFLEGESVKDISETQKRIFLRKKGLS